MDGISIGICDSFGSVDGFWDSNVFQSFYSATANRTETVTDADADADADAAALPRLETSFKFTPFRSRFA